MTYAFVWSSLPSIVLGWLYGALALCGFAEDPMYRRGILIGYWRPWFAKRWRYSTTIGHCIMLHPDHGPRVFQHELVHIRQYEDLCLLGFIIGALLCIVDWRVGLVVWATSGAPWLLPNFLTGWVRFGDPYYGSEHERSAYAQTD